MTVASEIQRLQTAKANIKASIEGKGVAVPSATLISGYSALIDAISGGGGGVISRPYKSVNFFDYDGTIVESYTAQEWASVSALPNNPSHDGLIAQGWNWTKAQIDAQVAVQGRCDIGQMYITTSGATEIDIELVGERLSPVVGICPNGTVSVDWGDGSSASTITGTSVNTIRNASHTYSSAGEYTIKLSVVSGSFAIVGTSNYPRLLWKNSTSQGDNRVYANAIKRIRLGNGASIGDRAFTRCYSLTSITMPNTLTSIGDYIFYYCYGLKCVIVPNSLNRTGATMFGDCYTLKNVSLSSAITNINSNTFANCYALENVVIPSGVTTISTSAFNNCQAITSVWIPSGVTSIGGGAFGACPSVLSYYVLPSTPPTLANSNAFSGMASDCKIYVPSESVETYKAASNWSNYVPYISALPS